MKGYTCPHCGKPGVSAAQKMFLGPIFPTTCTACKKKVGVPYTAVLAVIPFVVAYVISMRFDQAPMKAVLWASGSLLMLVIHMRLVPLQKR